MPLLERNQLWADSASDGPGPRHEIHSPGNTPGKENTGSEKWDAIQGVLLETMQKHHLCLHPFGKIRSNPERKLQAPINPFFIPPGIFLVMML